MGAGAEPERIEEFIGTSRERLRPVWEAIARRVVANTARVLAAFRRHRVGSHHFAESTGYGYQDTGRETLEKVFAEVFGGEAALVRPQIVTGTQAVAGCLFGLARPGGEVLLAGEPYPTLRPVLERLARWGVSARRLPRELTPEQVAEAVGRHTRLVLLARSGGYRPVRGFGVREIGQVAAALERVRRAGRGPAWLVVDNCYGEFVEEEEPLHQGADLVAGSLIKNPGGGLAPTGGYVAGRRELVEAVAEHLVAPGQGAAVGPLVGGARLYFQGLFAAPHGVGEALAGATLFADVFARLGFPVLPGPFDPRSDLVQGICLGEGAALLAFCRAIQSTGPVDTAARPEPAPLPGYDERVVMAAPTFVAGASLELSADAPFVPPFWAFLQAGTSRAHAELALARVLAALAGSGSLPNLP